MINTLWIVSAFALLLCNAFFVAAEFGMVKLRATRVDTLKEERGLRGRILFTVHQHLDAYLSACQLGITLASLGLGWIGEPAFASIFEPLLYDLGIVSHELITTFSFSMAFLWISFLHIVVGELMPKSMAIRQSEKISLWTAVPLYGFYWLMYPAIWILNNCSNLFLKMLGLSATHHSEHLYSTEEIKMLLNASRKHGDLTTEEVDIIAHTLDFTELHVTEVMRPREDMVMLDIKQPIADMMDTLMQHRYSRYPVYDSEMQHVIGVIHVKDLLPSLYLHGEIKELRAFIRPILKVSQRELAIDLLQKFREGKPHFALVYSQHKALSGFVTLDNLLQVLIGRIKDEFHLTEIDWRAQADGSFLVKGNCSLYSLEQALTCDIEVNDTETDTLSGLILYRLGDLPAEGTKIDFAEFSGVINKVHGSRILEVKVYPKHADL